MKPKYLVGVRPTGKLHVGHLIGPISRAIELQELGEDVTFLVAQFHAPGSGEGDHNCTKDELEILGAKKVTLQDPQTLTRFFGLLTKAKVSELLRTPSYKDKGKTAHDLLYPVLMAADIDQFGADVVIIGQDQLPHVEMASRLLGRKIATEVSVSTIRSLKNPELKMSKSLEEAHCLYLQDDYEAKLSKAVTSEAGIANLRIIGDFYNVPFTNKMSDYKQAISEAMSKKHKLLCLRVSTSEPKST